VVFSSKTVGQINFKAFGLDVGLNLFGQEQIHLNAIANNFHLSN